LEKRNIKINKNKNLSDNININIIINSNIKIFENILIEKIISRRKLSIIKIQSFIRGEKIRKNIKPIVNKLYENYIFLYDFDTKFFDSNENLKEFYF
jgi:hypothetical protein